MIYAEHPNPRLKAGGWMRHLALDEEERAMLEAELGVRPSAVYTFGVTDEELPSFLRRVVDALEGDLVLLTDADEVALQRKDGVLEVLDPAYTPAP